MPAAWLELPGQRLLVHGLQFGIGRESGQPAVLTDPSVSRHHAQLVFTLGDWWLWDLDSRNGTFHNDARVTQPVRLAPGDRLRFGVVEATFLLLPDPATDTVRTPPAP